MKKSKNKKKKDPLSFKCKSCGNVFVSNEYKTGMMVPMGGSYPMAEEKCPNCGKKATGGQLYRPLIGSKEWQKWYED